MRLVAQSLLLACLAGCNQPDMEDQPRVDTYETPESLPHQLAARPVPDGTVARDDDLNPLPSHNPLPVTHELLQRGRERFDIFCAPCHGRNGYGQGVIVQRGLPAPPSYHTARLRQANDEYIYSVITDGYGVMYSYASRLTPRDRWAVVAYIRALQFSQNARPADMPASAAPLADAAEPPEAEQ